MNLSTTEVCRALGLNISIEQIKAAGVQPVFETGKGAYWRPEDLPRICAGVAKRMIDLSVELAESGGK